MGLYQSAAGFAGGAFFVINKPKSVMLFGVLESKETKSYQHGLETLDALFNIEPNEPMKHVEDINAHFSWPKNWS